MFKNRRVAIHILRGMVGFGLLAVGLRYATVLGWWTVAPLAGALFVFRGCPMCWTVGLVETVLHRQVRSGSCAVSDDRRAD